MLYCGLQWHSLIYFIVWGDLEARGDQKERGGEGNEWKVKGGKEEEGKKRNETFHVRQEGEIISGNNGREKRLEKDSKSGYKEKLKTMRLSRLRLQGGNKEGDRKQ